MNGTRISSLSGKMTVLVIICLFAVSAQGKYGGGSGTEEDPYQIWDANHMQAIGADSDDWDKHFKLMADIDLSGFRGTSFNIIGYYVSYNDKKPFTGVFDGNGHTISNFTYTSAGADEIGLFGYVTGEIKDLLLIDPNVDAGTGDYVGSLVCRLSGGTISNCYVAGGSISGDSRVGGLVGYNSDGTITDCYSTGSVSGRSLVGGLVGRNFRDTITNCYSTGSVSGYSAVGGLVGENDRGTINNCYATSSVIGNRYVGGLVGGDYRGTIINCYAAGSVSGNDYVGGLLGLNWSSGMVFNSFWDVETSGQTTSDGGRGKTTAEMQKASTFIGWGCGSVWTIDDGNDYPRLAWQNLPGVLILIYEPVYGGGNGTEADPYQIWTAEQLNTIGLIICDWDKHFKLMADIDLSAFTGTAFNIIGYRVSSSDNKPFTGVFDGNSHTILNFTYTSPGTSYIGLFGYVRGEIKNLGLIDSNVNAGTRSYVGSLVGGFGGTITNCYVEGGNVEGGGYVGGLVGEYEGGTITGCYATASVWGDQYVGGLAGSDYGGTIINCYAAGSITGDNSVGGLVGDNDRGTITNCCATGSVIGNRYVGGLVGYGTYGTVTNCYATGSASGNEYVGGLFGENYGTISNCYSTGSVSGDVDIGGLVGRHNHGRIINCYAAGSVSGNDDVGGLVGSNLYATVFNSFWDIETSGQTTSAGGMGKTTAEMHKASTFIGWGCGAVWTIDESNDYPRLLWETQPGQLITNPSCWQGSGTETDPYLIYTAEQLSNVCLIACEWDKHFKLMTDIDLAEYTEEGFKVIGNSANPFTGVFDGNGHTVSNLTCDRYSSRYRGLFGYVNGGEIVNLGLVDPNVDAGTGSMVGSLVGRLIGGTISNCYVGGGSVSGGHYVGGLVGNNGYGTITNCYSTVSVAGNVEIGGLVGRNWSGTITNCYSTGSVSGTGWEVGGLVGMNKGTITNCYSTGSVSGTGWDVGGLVGINSGTITNCYSTGSVMGNRNVGGLVGNNGSGLITNSYSSGSVFGTYYTGGLVGSGRRGYVSGSYWDIESSGQSTSAGGTGKTKAEMKMADTFVYWGSCGEVWTIDEGVDYPRLWWENKPGEIITAPSVLYGGGIGELNDPYLIYTAEQLSNVGFIACDWDKHFKLMADIDLAGYTNEGFKVIGTSANPFTGVFNGNGHTVSNLACDHYSSRYRGLFGYVSGGDIVNLGLIDPNVAGGSSAGSLVGYMEDGNIVNCYAEGGSAEGDGPVGGLVGNNSGTITNCYATGSIYAELVWWGLGGLVGWNYGTITNCYVTGSIYTEENLDPVGGLVGCNYGTVTDCHTTGSIYAEVSSEPIGGLVGRNNYGTISNCYSTGSVSGDQYVGGLVGENYYSGIISNCYATGSVSGTGWEIGGLTGINIGAIYNCYATGNVEGDEEVGGLVGKNGSRYSLFNIIYNCYSTGGVSGVENVGGLVGSNDGEVYASFWDIETSGQTTSAGGSGLTTNQMQIPEPFLEAGWDFIYQPDGPHDIWTEPLGGGYPILWWQFSPLPPLPAFSGGTGTTQDPYLISTANELNQIGHNPRLMSAHFKLINDIDLTGTDFFLIGSQAYPFSCVFNGNGNTISNFTYDANRANHVGIFGCVDGENAEIKNLGLINPNVDAGTGDCVGSLVGRISGGAITGCYVKGGSVSGHYSVGGLVGEIVRGTITNCYSTGSISGYSGVGGLVGHNIGTVTSCYSTGSVVGDYCVGSLVGFNYFTITNCYSTGSVVGENYVGGLVGENYYPGKITNCYSTGSVSGDEKVGGLVGYSVDGEVTDSFWDIETSGQDWSDGGMGLATEQMQMMSTFTDAGWDFVGETANGIEDIWFIPQGDYPHLWWEGMQVPMKLTPGTLNCRSEGNWVKAHITLPEGVIVADVNSNIPAVLHSLGFQSTPLYVFENKDKLVEIEAAFEREAVCSLTGDWPEALTVAGFLSDGNIFLGTSTVRIIHPGMKVIEELASCWLNADCVQPDFCDGIDMNRDSLVNLLDYALLVNINLEFITDE